MRKIENNDTHEIHRCQEAHKDASKMCSVNGSRRSENPVDLLHFSTHKRSAKCFHAFNVMQVLKQSFHEYFPNNTCTVGRNQVEMRCGHTGCRDAFARNSPP